MHYIYAILIAFLFVGCMPEPAPVDTSATDRTGSSASDDTFTEDSTNFSSEINWLDSGLSSTSLTLSTKDSKNLYFVGDEVHNFLEISENFNATYCLEIRFQQTGSAVPKRIRAKVIPAVSNLLSNGKSMRYLRVNLNVESGNDFCNISSLETVAGVSVLVLAGDSNYVDSNSSSYLSVVDGTDVSLVNKAEDVCPTCLNGINDESIVFYKYSTTNNYLERVSTGSLNYKALSLSINLDATSNDSGGSCNTNACQSSGFDCCVEGQCVNEKSVILSGVQASPSAFIAAEKEKFSNSAWYKRYPQFYNICPELPDATPPTDDDEDVDPDADAQTRLEELAADYACMLELAEKSESIPFHRGPITTGQTYTSCETTIETEPLYYESVLKRLYENCGCSEKDDLDVMVLNCPAYTYKPIYEQDVDGNDTATVNSYVCITPPEETTPLPFQDLEVIVNSKTAPHRFFNETGEEINPEEPIESGVNTTQEGEKFEYLDDTFIFPRTGSFNMNAILGQMTVSLNQARPAKVIDLEFDKQYIISTRSGLYSACPGCAKDPWYNGFSTNPTAEKGVGLRSVGFSTTRDSFDSNLTLGSYADTSFGRACWVPPTMLAFSHLEDSSKQTQRLNRLMTQATMYSNGYQKDWYGFNKGALIGSFDGVTWFAVGKGRIVTSSSNKLYLAINAPFADLASPTDHVVAVQEYDFSATAPTLDYDPELESNSPSQNEAATCQKNHECETDAHCITKLGWEYACADVSAVQTKWPNFEPLGANEISSVSRTGTIAQFLQQATLPPGSSSKRCVYRGAGAPCRVDAQNITDEALRENLTCAPNFYCAAVSTANVFNDQVSRFAKPLNELVEGKNHLFGLDANILGRPKQYISIGNLKTLPGKVQANLKANIQLSDASALQVGLCRPGKKLPSYSSLTETNDWDQSDQHESSDNLFRTDYISQIAGCNSALYTDLRYSSCPMLDQTGNYINTQETFLNDNFFNTETETTLTKKDATEVFSSAQNSCGLEALHPDATISTGSTSEFLSNFSAFKSIEGRSLAMSNTIVEKTLVRDACLRKAGAVCHTDLDCSPNKMMAANVDTISISYFGNEAEKNYYSEPLICGQAEAKPALGDDNFNTYNIENNRCCRPIGAELTMFTEDSPATGSEASIGLRSDVFGSLDPTNAQRYSRYSVVGASIDRENKESNLIRPTANTQDLDNDKLLDNAVNITNTNQWETIHNAAAKTCCGGSWVRKFADGSNDWSRQRLSLDVSNFSCLNYRSPLAKTEEATAFGLNENELGRDRGDFCTDVTKNAGGCIETEFGDINDFSIIRPTLNLVNFEMIIDSDVDVMQSLWPTNLWSFHKLMSSDEGATDVSGSNLIMDWTVADQSEAERLNITTTLPSYIAFDEISNIRLENPDGASFGICSRLTPAGDDYSCGGPYGICGPKDQWPALSCAGDCCYTFNPDTRKLVIAHPKATSDNPLNYDDNGNILSARISFTAPGTLLWEQVKAGAATVSDETFIAHRRSSTPGNALYYLKRLSRLEYLGIPQMNYDPIYCNDNYQNLVPGIYHESIFGQALKTVSDYLAHDRTYIDLNTDEPWNADSAPAPHNANGLNTQLTSSSELINHNAIFSDNKFQCCLELGSKTDNGSECCSGVAVDEDGNTTANSGERNLTCKLPNETNLNVYFNKFVSGEGLSDFDNGSPLELTDFNIKTGEPLTNSSVLAKLNTLGETFCASGKVRRGGAFGNFQAKPFGPLREPVSSSTGDTQFTIVDDISDFGNINNRVTGYQIFKFGYKWNHHIYCDGLETN